MKIIAVLCGIFLFGIGTLIIGALYWALSNMRWLFSYILFMALIGYLIVSYIGIEIYRNWD